MKIGLIVFFIAISIGSWCQVPITFPIIKEYKKFNWASVEKKVTRAEKDKFINAFPKEFEAYRIKENQEFHNLDSLAKDLHFVDLNGDGKTDVIFDGESGGEARLIQIFVRGAQGFKKAFSDMQGIAKIDWEENKVKRLYINNWGCCADYQETNKIYEVNYDDQANPSFKQIYQSVSIFLWSTKRPDSLFEKPIRFEVLNNNYKIRFSPHIDDTSGYQWSKDFEKTGKGDGNCIGRIPKGSTGTALGKKTDATGREWWYVEMDEQYKFDLDIFYVENKFPTRVIGWISSRFVKVL